MGNGTDSGTVLLEILDELKKIRFALEDRKPTKSGGAFPKNPSIELVKQANGKWRGTVPPEAVFKPCKDGCGTEISWMDTQFGPRPCQKDGEQHYCPNYVPKGQREADPEPKAPADAPDFDSDAVPF